jgi:hypothetical protein
VGNRAEFSDRRRFERLELGDDAIAVDETGRELGKVMQASGGGMMVKPKSSEVAASLAQGQRVQVTVMEPGSQTRHTIDMVVRYASAEKIGLEFVGGNG